MPPPLTRVHCKPPKELAGVPDGFVENDKLITSAMPKFVVLLPEKLSLAVSTPVNVAAVTGALFWKFVIGHSPASGWPQSDVAGKLLMKKTVALPTPTALIKPELLMVATAVLTHRARKS